ncbi:MAG: VOC family protein [Bacillota bacterium]|nr:VOC family protein [Bacillota bacterium]HHU62059.1 VOC family protein [Natronincola sp.]
MTKELLGTDVVVQIGIIVNDIEKTAEEWAKFLGVTKPEYIITDDYELAQTEYRGKPTKAKAKLAFFSLSNIEIELIEPDDEPSTWREFLTEHGEGVHHIAFKIKGQEEKTQRLEKMGFKLVQKGEYTGGRYTYFDSFPRLKILLELLEND